MRNSAKKHMHSSYHSKFWWHIPAFSNCFRNIKASQLRSWKNRTKGILNYYTQVIYNTCIYIHRHTEISLLYTLTTITIPCLHTYIHIHMYIYIYIHIMFILEYLNAYMAYMIWLGHLRCTSTLALKLVAAVIRHPRCLVVGETGAGVGASNKKPPIWEW